MRRALLGAPDVVVAIQSDTDGPAQATWSRGGLLARVREFGPDVVSFSFGLLEDPDVEAEFGVLQKMTETGAELLGERELTVLFSRPA